MQKLYLSSSTLVQTLQGLQKIDELAGKKVQVVSEGKVLNAIVESKPISVEKSWRIFYNGVSSCIHPQASLYSLPFRASKSTYNLISKIDRLVLKFYYFDSTIDVLEAHFLGFMLAGGFSFQFSGGSICLEVIDPYGKDWLSLQQSMPSGCVMERSHSFNSQLKIYNINLNSELIKLAYHNPEKLLYKIVSWNKKSQLEFLKGILNAHRLLNKPAKYLSFLSRAECLNGWLHFFYNLQLPVKHSVVKDAKVVMFNPAHTIKTSHRLHVNLENLTNIMQTKSMELKIEIEPVLIDDHNALFYSLIFYDNLIKSFTLPNGLSFQVV